MLSKSILVVDDSAVMRRIISNHLHGLGHRNILEAADGETALAVLRAERIDLIISDWCMQGMHGIDLLRAIRADAALAKLPFIMVTAEGQPHSIIEAREAGVDRYVLKPFTREILAQALKIIFIPAAPRRKDPAFSEDRA
jgi:two-component system, chemotaxis family, chemotaxis protein CheY